MKENKEILNAQNRHWENSFLEMPDMFGVKPGFPALETIKLIGGGKEINILELGAGQGRDSVFFAKQGCKVTALDYTEAGLISINNKISKLGLERKLTTVKHDIRKPLPFADNYFDICYSSMLFCMALITMELEFLVREITRILKPAGYCVYSVRHTGDPHFGKGIHRGENMYEVDGFIVHFFDKEKIRQLSNGFNIIDICEFEEGGLPRKLFLVVMRKV